MSPGTRLSSLGFWRNLYQLLRDLVTGESRKREESNRRFYADKRQRRDQEDRARRRRDNARDRARNRRGT